MAMPDRGAPGLNQIRVEREVRPLITVSRWRPADVDELVRLEQGWAPWLQKPPDRIRAIANNSRKTRTHLKAATPTGKLVGDLSATRTFWYRDPEDLGPWDRYAGGSVKQSDYPGYQMHGNTIIFMSLTVDPEHQRQGVARALVTEMKNIANADPAIQNVIGPFRPSDFGRRKMDTSKPPITFEDYCHEVINGEQHDTWLEAAMNMGMLPLTNKGRLLTAEYSMTVRVPIADFKDYRDNYQPYGEWKKINGKWESGEAGSFIVIGDEDDPRSYALYIEPNLWGEIPILSTVPSQRNPVE